MVASLTFSGSTYKRLFPRSDEPHDFPITHLWKEVVGRVDAVFYYTDLMYLIQVHILTCSDIKP